MLRIECVCPCPCCRHHLLVPTLEIITFIGLFPSLLYYDFGTFAVQPFSLSLLHLCMNFLVVAPAEGGSASNDATNYYLCPYSTVPRILISINEGCFKGHQVSRERITAQGDETEVDYGDKGYVTLMRTSLKSFTPPF